VRGASVPSETFIIKHCCFGFGLAKVIITILSLMMATTTRSLSHHDYTVALVCALPLEMAAAQSMLDEIHPDLPTSSNDQNTYVLGRVRAHNVVIACLPSGVYGTTSAATVANQMLFT
jgi:hypothetical protein